MSTCTLSGLTGSGCGPPKGDIKLARDNAVLALFATVTVVGKSGEILARAVNAAICGGISGLLSVLSDITGSLVNNSKDSKITVGNDSIAVIKSLNVGGSNGCGANIEIVDQEGGDFSRVFQKIARGGTSNTYSINLTFGWIETDDCPGGSGGKKDLVSDTLTYVISNMTINYTANGALKFTIECIDAVEGLFDSKGDFSYQSNDGITLKEAIKKLLGNRNICVLYKDLSTGSQNPPDLKFKGSGKEATDGPSQKIWAGKNNSVLNIIQEWLNKTRAIVNGKEVGLKTAFLPASKDQTCGGKAAIVIYGDTAPLCVSNFLSSKPIGSYVVNGGNCSPVISFQPNIKWFGGPANARGGAGGGTQPGPVAGKGPLGNQNGCNQSQSPNLATCVGDIWPGNNISTTVDREDTLKDMDQASQRKQFTTYLNFIANMAWQPVQADLKIQGDPTLGRTLAWLGQYVSIVVLNPFLIDKTQCEWTNKITSPSSCNQVLSNNNWIIQGVNHDIRDGSFTTTLKVYLAAPGQGIPLSAQPGK